MNYIKFNKPIKLLLMIFLLIAESSILFSQLNVTSSGEVYIGSYVVGSTYQVEPPNNEITFTISDNININKEHNVILYYNNSENGSESDLKISTIWYTNTGVQFQNGTEFKFIGSMRVKVVIKSLQILSKNICGHKIRFKQLLEVKELN